MLEALIFLRAYVRLSTKSVHRTEVVEHRFEVQVRARRELLLDRGITPRNWLLEGGSRGQRGGQDERKRNAIFELVNMACLPLCRP